MRATTAKSCWPLRARLQYQGQGLPELLLPPPHYQVDRRMFVGPFTARTQNPVVISESERQRAAAMFRETDAGDALINNGSDATSGTADHLSSEFVPCSGYE